MTDIVLASDRVEEVAEELPFEDEVVEKAKEWAREFSDEGTSDRAPSAVAAAALYVASHTPKNRSAPGGGWPTPSKRVRLSQAQLAEALGISVGPVSETWQELAGGLDLNVVKLGPGSAPIVKETL